MCQYLLFFLRVNDTRIPLYVSVYTIFCLSILSIFGHLGCSFLSIVNNSAMNMRVSGRKNFTLLTCCTLWLPYSSDGKESTCNAGDWGFDPWIRKIPWRKKQQSTPVFLPGEFHGQRSLAGYSPWGHKELDTTKWLTHTQLGPVN